MITNDILFQKYGIVKIEIDEPFPLKRNAKALEKFLEKLELYLKAQNYGFRFEEATLVFETVYNTDEKGVRWTDNDNFAIKMITDVLQRYLLTSDNSKLTTSVCCATLSPCFKHKSAIYIIPMKINASDILDLYFRRCTK